MANAREKMQRKGLDMIVLNSTRDAGATFGHDTNKVTILTATGEHTEYPLKCKREVAADIVNRMEAYGTGS
jgi:phosphopantothenoylcysteine decarboxylase/phosphopantothenate--cysteine ligase